MKKIFLNGKEIKGNEKIKEGDCIVCIDKIEGTVYEFQGNKNWSNVNGSFKDKVIKAMCELYCQYKKEGKTWKILEITSAYRTEREQAEAMVDYVLVKGKNELTNIYTGDTHYLALQLLSELFYEMNHLACNNGCIHDKVQIICGQYVNQISLYNGISQGKNLFDIYVNNGNESLKNNISKAKDLLESWLKVSGMKSHHELGLALDFSSNTPTDQRDDLLRLFESPNYKLSTLVYKSENFHVSQK